MRSGRAIGRLSDAQSLGIRAKAISLTFARNMVALEKVVYRHDQRKISDAMVTDIALNGASGTSAVENFPVIALRFPCYAEIVPC